MVVDGWVVDGSAVDGAVVDGVVVDGVVVDGCDVVGSVVVAGGVAVSGVVSFFGIRRTTRMMTTTARIIPRTVFRLMLGSSWVHPTGELYHGNHNRR